MQPIPLFYETPFGARVHGHFGPRLDPTGGIALEAGEQALWQATGGMSHNLMPWEGAPEEQLYFPPGDTHLMATPARLAWVCQEYLEARIAKDRVARSNTLSGALAGLAFQTAAQGRHNAQARAGTAGRAMAGQVPWRCVSLVGLLPLDEPVDAIVSSIVLGCEQQGAMHLLYVGVPGPLMSTREIAEWFVRLIAAAHLASPETFGAASPEDDQALRGELDQCSQNPEAEVDGGVLRWVLPISCDLDVFAAMTPPAPDVLRPPPPGQTLPPPPGSGVRPPPPGQAPPPPPGQALPPPPNQGWAASTSRPQPGVESGPAAPLLAGSQFCYRETRRFEQESTDLRGCQPPYDVYEFFEGRGLYNSSGTRLTPGWAARDVRAFDLHPSGRAAALHLVHPPPTPRLFGCDSRPDDPPMRELPRFTVLENRSFSVCGTDISPDGTQLACLEWLGIGVLSLYDLPTGTRTFVTTLEGVAGGEMPSWSSDGEWLLIPSSRPLIVSPREGLIINLSVDDTYMQADWWPSQGASCLLTLVGDEVQSMECLDLSTNTCRHIGPVDMERQADLAANRQLLSNPKVSPDGRVALIGSNLGPPGEYQEAFGSQQRWATIDLTTRRLQHHGSPWCDEGSWVERCQDHWRWFERPISTGAVDVCAEIRERAIPLNATDPSAERWDPAVQDESVVMWHW